MYIKYNKILADLVFDNNKVLADLVFAITKKTWVYFTADPGENTKLNYG